MTKPKLSARFPRFTAAVVAGMFASTAALPLAMAKPPAAAAAKKPDKKTRDAARTAYGEGKAAFEKGDFDAAAAGFKKADELIPSPQAVYWIAKSLDKGGHADEAAAAYQKFLDDPDIAKASDDKVSEAKARIAELKNKPAEVNVSTTPPGATVTVDGQAQMGETPMVVKMPPGTHTLEIAAPGYDAQKLDVTVTSGEKIERKLTLNLSESAPVPAAVAPPPADTAPAPEPAAPPEKKSKTPAYVTLGIAGVGAIVGTIFGVKALSAKKDFNSTPTNDNADTVERNALISDMAFGVAITLGVTGVVLLTSSGSSDSGKDAAKLDRLPKKATLQVTPYAGPHGGGAAARLTF